MPSKTDETPWPEKMRVSEPEPAQSVTYSHDDEMLRRLVSDVDELKTAADRAMRIPFGAKRAEKLLKEASRLRRMVCTRMKYLYPEQTAKYRKWEADVGHVQFEEPIDDLTNE